MSTSKGKEKLKEIEIRIDELLMARNTVCFSEQSLEQRNYFDKRISELNILKNKNELRHN